MRERQTTYYYIIKNIITNYNTKWKICSRKEEYKKNMIYTINEIRKIFFLVLIEIFVGNLGVRGM